MAHPAGGTLLDRGRLPAGGQLSPEMESSRKKSPSGTPPEGTDDGRRTKLERGHLLIGPADDVSLRGLWVVTRRQGRSAWLLQHMGSMVAEVRMTNADMMHVQEEWKLVRWEDGELQEVAWPTTQREGATDVRGGGPPDTAEPGSGGV